MTDHLTIPRSEADGRAVGAVEQHHAQMVGALALKAESLAAVVRAARLADLDEVRLDLVRWCREELLPHPGRGVEHVLGGRQRPRPR